jgi:hydroxyethylthiazole kinase-like uncharacterized protein yjeF
MRPLPDRHPTPLLRVASTRDLEHRLASRLPPHALMARAGLALARLVLALHPHARRLWIACGPGNNGGDALIAATHLHRWRLERGAGPELYISRCAGSGVPSSDTAWALEEAHAYGLPIHDDPPPAWDVAIDGLLGIGATRAPAGALGRHWQALFSSHRPVLCVDLPSGLDADTGHWYTPDGVRPCPGQPRSTLTMLAAKPGLFTADGRDAAGQVWLAPLVDEPVPTADAWLGAAAAAAITRPHAAHKGSQGDVVVIGGQDIRPAGLGMTGAAVLAARAALHAGAGRVYVGLLAGDGHAPGWDPQCPELMFRRPDRLLLPDLLANAVTVCGCGGGQAVASQLPTILRQARRLVLDADALNLVATHALLRRLLVERANRAGWLTVLTPHPLEAGRLLGLASADVQADRLAAAQRLAETLGVICVLKGSGSIVAAPGRTPIINPSGNPALATAGTGDVLAGLVGSLIAQPAPEGEDAMATVARAVWLHGHAADRWVARSPARHLDAGTLARLLAD